MENNELHTNDQPMENSFDENEAVNNEAINADAAAKDETMPSDTGEAGGNGNLEICPNCLEPNTDDLAVCKYCGMPLHQGADAEEFEMQEDEAALAKNRAEAAPESTKPKKKQESGFRRVMPWLGLYLIYYAITGFFDVKRQVQQALEEGQQVNEKLAYFSQVIWLAAGLMMAWPLIKKGYRKLRHLPDPDEEEEAAEETAETSEEPKNDAETESTQAEEELPEGASESERIEAEAAEQEPELLPDSQEQTDDSQEPVENNTEFEAKLSNEDGTEEDERANWL